MIDGRVGRTHDAVKMCVRLLAGIVLSGALVVSAQTNVPVAGPRAMALADCIDLALSRNLDLQIEHLSTEIARYNLSGAYGAYIPNLSFGAEHDYSSAPGMFDPKKFNPYFPFELDTDNSGPSLEGRLPLGFSYELSARAGENRSRTDFGGDPDYIKDFPGGIRLTNNYFADIGLSIRQHLLKDFWIDEYRQTLLFRRKELKMSEQALQFQIMKTVLAVELGFDDVLAAREQIRVEEKLLEVRQELVAETRRRVEVGDMPPLESEQAQTRLQMTLTALAAARELSAARQNALKSLFTDNFREWAEVDLEPMGSLLAIKAEFNRQRSFQAAMKNRPDLAEARLAAEKSTVAVQYRKNQLFPALDFIGRYGGLGSQSDFGASVSEAVRFTQPNYYYGVVVSFPLSNVAERNSYRASKAAKQIAELQLKKAEQAILVEVADYINQAESRYAQVDSTRKARTYAEAALAAEWKKLQNGLSTMYMVLELQEVLRAAQTAEIQAQVSYNKALAQLAFAEGSTMARHHLRLEGK